MIAEDHPCPGVPRLGGPLPLLTHVLLTPSFPGHTWAHLDTQQLQGPLWRDCRRCRAITPGSGPLGGPAARPRTSNVAARWPDDDAGRHHARLIFPLARRLADTIPASTMIMRAADVLAGLHLHGRHGGRAAALSSIVPS